MIYLLIFISGVAKAVMDVISFHFDKSVFTSLTAKFWNPAISWENKYYNVAKRKRWRFMGVPIPVAFTDGWHLFQSIFLTSLFVSIVIYKPIFNYHEIDAIRMIADFVILRGCLD